MPGAPKVMVVLLTSRSCMASTLFVLCGVSAILGDGYRI